MSDLLAQIARNVAEIRGRIADAATRSGRTADDVALVAVTKYVSADLVRLLLQPVVTTWAKTARSNSGRRRPS